MRRLALDTRPFRDSPAFRRLWIGQAISVIGGEITFVAIPIQTYHLTHSTLAVGLLGFCTLGPLLVVPLVGGTLADALDRRRLLLRTEVAVALVSVLLAVNAALPHPQVWALYVLLTLGTTAFSLGTPAMRSLLPKIVDQDQIAAASALEGIYSNLAAVAGPVVANAVRVRPAIPVMPAILVSRELMKRSLRCLGAGCRPRRGLAAASRSQAALDRMNGERGVTVG